MTKLIRVLVPIDKIVQTTSNDGGYLGGKCILCGAYGWTNPDKIKYGQFGLPNHSKHMKDTKGENLYMGNWLYHDRKCPMNKVLEDDGSPRSESLS